MKKKRVLFASYYGTGDIASFNCAHGPFSMLRDEVEIIVPTALEFDPQTATQSQWWRNFRWWLGIDVCYLHRPSGAYGKAIIETCKEYDIPLWVHHDDDLLAIPTTNPYYATVTHDKEYPSVELSYKEADILTCQSVLMHQMLKEKYGREDSILIPISLDDRLLHLKRPWTDNNRICWRGSDSHRHDLLSFKLELQEIFDKYAEKEFHFTILNPRELGFRVKNLVVHPAMSFFKYYKNLCEINASHHIVLLEDTPFNRVKSHLAWLDATLAGSVVIAPDYPEFQRDGCNTYVKNDLVGRCDRGFTDTAQQHDFSWKEIELKYLNSVTNKQRLSILNNL